ncbi:hypothetical protein N7471_010429 [Penicillium samsonianum]|uniref:uncharacterized protein n=1 Tax=Penicillium samsonianum TaxID=1882272 RepID=UPI002549AC38|nr:uncharacterized protein N7471_010429 [Penicillium samsonianum]KAJ6125936.1 hypothetical protein N7471_010429 [Penicillium samsonianum]
MSLSTIESLPNEIIEAIFLEALEINLARASNVIAAAISREPVYTVFMIHAFWNDPQDCDRQRHFDRESVYTNVRFQKADYRESSAIRLALRPGQYHPLSIQDQKKIQSQVVSCHWFNIHRFLRLLPTLLALTLDALILHENCRFPSIETQERQCSAARTIDSFRQNHLLTNDGYPKQLRVIDYLTIQATYYYLEHGRPHIVRTARILVLPEKVLRGPWDTDRLDLLVTLRRAFGKRFTTLDFSAGAVKQRFLAPEFSEAACLLGIEMAIRQNSRRALVYLVEIWDSFLPIHGGNVIRRKSLPDELLTMAMQNYTTDFDILYLLIQAKLPSVRKSREVMKWAQLASLHGSIARGWLVSYMQGQHLSNNGLHFWKTYRSIRFSKQPLLERESWF